LHIRHTAFVCKPDTGNHGESNPKGCIKKAGRNQRIEEVGPTREGFTDATQEFYEGALMKKL
jgi:hypothetical protein